MFDELVIYLAVQGQVAPYYRFSGSGSVMGLLSRVLPLNMAYPRSTTTEGNPNWTVRIEGEVTLFAERQNG